MAGLIAVRPCSRTRLYHRLRTHPAGKGKRRSTGERDFIGDRITYPALAPSIGYF
ncbi:hypothetical protein ACIRU3_38380 [Streptomyces sp. NPDC101151]|uniref:hypothetical protein n=1 Tax=Streptomyces sp. NPDC101151 TaxID=3366115 RepID=UPI00382C8434